MRNPIAAVAILVLLAGCASNRSASKYSPVDPALGRVLHDRGVYLLVAPTPDFRRMTGGDQATMTVGILFGPIGAGIGAAAAIEHARSAGRAIVKENEIADPSLRLVDRVREMLAAKYDSANTDSGATVTVSVDNWALAKDRVLFRASVVIANAADEVKKPAKPLAKGVCEYESASNGPTAEALLANRAAELKKELDTALEHCAEEFRTKFFL